MKKFLLGIVLFNFLFIACGNFGKELKLKEVEIREDAIYTKDGKKYSGILSNNYYLLFDELNGLIKLERRIKDGSVDGITKIFFLEDITDEEKMEKLGLAGEIEVKNNKIDGKYKLYRKNKLPSIETTMKANQFVDSFVYYYENGKKYVEIKFDDNKIVKVNQYYENGSLNYEADTIKRIFKLYSEDAKDSQLISEELDGYLSEVNKLLKNLKKEIDFINIQITLENERDTNQNNTPTNLSTGSTKKRLPKLEGAVNLAGGISYSLEQLERIEKEIDKEVTLKVKKYFGKGLSSFNEVIMSRVLVDKENKILRRERFSKEVFFSDVDKGERKEYVPQVRIFYDASDTSTREEFRVKFLNFVRELNIDKTVAFSFEMIRKNSENKGMEKWSYYNNLGYNSTSTGEKYYLIENDMFVVEDLVNDTTIEKLPMENGIMKE